MDSPSVKRSFDQRTDDPGSSQNKKRCLTPSITNYFAPRPKTVPSNAESSNLSPPPSKSNETLSPIPTTPRTPSRPQQPLTPQTLRVQTPTTPQIPRSIRRQPQDSPSVAREPREQNGISEEDLGHAHTSYEFLKPNKRCDINRRPPDDPDYDERTLYVPESFLNAQTPAMRQWWLIKQKNMDAILFFKMGKFYELFNEDAVIGVNNLDIIYMKSEEGKPAHAGFPEVSFPKYASILINKGYKILRIEQTETPAMMEERVKTTGRCTKFDRVVRREICQVTTKGTQMLGISDSVFHSSQNQYLLAVYESNRDPSEGNQREKLYGVCFIDVTIGKLYLGQFNDDNNLSNLNIMLAHNTPTEIIYERGNLSQSSHQALLRTGALLTPLKANKEFWPPKRAMSHIRAQKIFQNESGEFEWPAFMRNLFEDTVDGDSLLTGEPKVEFQLAVKSFSGVVYYLHSQLIEHQVLNCAEFELYIPPLCQAGALAPGNIQKKNQRASMIIDHVALRNLEIFVDSSGSTGATLYNCINNCKTHFGQRLLKYWICSPLCDKTQIENRLDAVEALMSNQNASLMNEINHVLGQIPDLERLLSKIKNQCFKSEGDTRAIMFDNDQHSKAKISSFLNLLNNFKRLQKFIISVKPNLEYCNSDVLRRLLSSTTDGGLFPDYSATMDYFDNAFDHRSAQQTGKIIPSLGVDTDYDTCESNIKKLKQRLEDYLEDQKRILKCRHLEFFGTAKNRYQIQIPDTYCNNLPADYRIETTRKGYKRYYTPVIDEYFAKLTTYEEEMKKILDNIMSKIFEQFVRKIKLWSAAIECVAVLDVLQSIATFARSLKAKNIEICRPTLVDGQSKPLIEYTQGRHPVLVKTNPNYIDNSLAIDDVLLLLSGANMGGKSTLMRQTALLVILAQIGCHVPAASMRLTPVDRIFSRLGASDRILEGESTFYTELVETSSMLQYATRDSLLLLDELGRGTSTYDGTAIAYSVIKEISERLKCRCIFSTHYHTLTRDFVSSEKVKLAHMACRIEKDSEDSLDSDPLKENLSFLYKIAEGPAARSYGFNVAKLAGINDDIIKDAFMKAKEIELACKVVTALQTVCHESAFDPNSQNSIKDRVLSLVKST